MKVTKSCVRAAVIAVSLGCAAPCTSAQAQDKAADGEKATITLTENIVGGDDGKGERRVIVLQAQGDKNASDKADKEVQTLEVRMLADQPKIWIGIGLKELSGDLAAYLGNADGVMIESIYPESPAAAAKLQEGDILLSVNGDKVSSPTAMLDKLKAIAKDLKSEKAEELAPLKLKLLRRGETLEVEVKAGPRPEHLLAQGNVLKEMPAGLADIVQRMEKDGQVQVLRFGQPADISAEALANIADRDEKNQVKSVQNFTFVLQDGDKKTEVQVHQSGDGKAKITVKEGDKTRELTEDQLSELPEKVREMVKGALSKKSIRIHAGHAAAEAEIAHAHKAAAEAHQHVNEHMKKAMEIMGQKIKGNVIVMGPDGEIRTDVIVKDMAEIAEKVKADAKAAGEKAAETVKIYAGVPGQVDELRKEIEALRAQIAELKAQLNKEKGSGDENK